MRNSWFKVCYLDGTPDGIVKCAHDRAGVISYRVPRNRLADIKGLTGTAQSDFENPGVYVLVGKPALDEESNSVKTPFYVGQAAQRKGVDPFYSRLNEHNKLEKRTREWWTTAYVFMDVARSSQRISETGLKYLENSIYSIAQGNPAFWVKNGNEPPGGSPDESMQSVLDAFLEGLVNCASVLGLRLDPIKDEEDVAASPSAPMRSFHGSTVWGESNLLVTGTDKFTVLKGSMIRTSEEAKSLSKGSLKNRKLHEKAYMPDGVLKENITFGSASAAAEFVAGTPVNGLDFWYTEQGETMKSILKDSKTKAQN